MNTKKRDVVVLYGGLGGEREVSFRSAFQTMQALQINFNVTGIQLDENNLPDCLLKNPCMVFPLIHGEFGEDGQLQHLLDLANIPYVGSGFEASSACMDKIKTKAIATEWSVPTLPAMTVKKGDQLSKDELIRRVGHNYVLKPTNEGSSLGVELCENFSELNAAWANVKSGSWMIEKMVKGRELTVGVVCGEAMGVVEIAPKKGFYDFKNKYTSGACEYRYPAYLPGDITKSLQNAAEVVFEKAGCLDLGRADFILDENGQFWFLEMNTIPGMTEHSLLPKSASCNGLSFEDLVFKILDSAFKRAESRSSMS